MKKGIWLKFKNIKKISKAAVVKSCNSKLSDGYPSRESIAGRQETSRTQNIGLLLIHIYSERRHVISRSLQELNVRQ